VSGFWEEKSPERFDARVETAGGSVSLCLTTDPIRSEPGVWHLFVSGLVVLELDLEECKDGLEAKHQALRKLNNYLSEFTSELVREMIRGDSKEKVR
jgi:hypothetical protein